MAISTEKNLKGIELFIHARVCCSRNGRLVSNTLKNYPMTLSHHLADWHRIPLTELTGEMVVKNSHSGSVGRKRKARCERRGLVLQSGIVCCARHIGADQSVSP